MKIDFIKSCKGNCDISKRIINDLANNILNKLQYNAENVTIEVLLVEKEKMREINKKFRKVNQATDVLSFPQKTIKKSPEKNIGSIIISPEVAEETKQKCSDLFIHGLLHLLGYDHETNKLKWKKAEERIIKNEL
jgi:probable rRNA maturation factor